MRIHRSTKPLERFQTLNNLVLSQVAKAKYFEIMITTNLNWNPHINSIVTKANRCTGFIKQYISNCPQQLKELVRSQLEYACDPYQIKEISILEKV